MKRRTFLAAAVAVPSATKGAQAGADDEAAHIAAQARWIAAELKRREG